MLWRVIEGKVVPASEELGISQIVWSPMAQGVLSGKYLPGRPVPEGSRATDPHSGADFIKSFLQDDILTAVQRLKTIAEQAGLSMPQLAIAWVLQNPNVAAALVGASRPEQLAETVKASGVKLDADTLAAIDAALGDTVNRDAEHDLLGVAEVPPGLTPDTRRPPFLGTAAFSLSRGRSVARRSAEGDVDLDLGGERSRSSRSASRSTDAGTFAGDGCLEQRRRRPWPHPGSRSRAPRCSVAWALRTAETSRTMPGSVVAEHLDLEQPIVGGIRIRRPGEHGESQQPLSLEPAQRGTQLRRPVFGDGHLDNAARTCRRAPPASCSPSCRRARPRHRRRRPRGQDGLHPRR